MIMVIVKAGRKHAIYATSNTPDHYSSVHKGMQRKHLHIPEPMCSLKYVFLVCVSSALSVVIRTHMVIDVRLLFKGKKMRSRL